MKFGIDRLIAEPALRRPLTGRRLALLANPASVTAGLVHSLDAIAALPGLRLNAAFGPQHGLRGDKQDNMVESPDFEDPQHGIPVFSLYGQVRRPTAAMMDCFDVLLVDLQDIGCRVYTFITTLRYLLQDCAAQGKAVWILDRPNPAGRPVEGLRLEAGWESFVGAGALPMRHGLTMGELARWFVAEFKLEVDLQVIEMQGWKSDAAPGYGWPVAERSWINPSPNAASLSMTRCYPGTVLLEGTTLSEGRGTTHPLEMVGAPDGNAQALLRWLRPARVLVRAHFPQARGPAVQRDPAARRCRRVSARGVPALAGDRGPAQSAARVAARRHAVARFPVRIRTHALALRRNQRRTTAAAMDRGG